jgi:4-amino-4-deoxy-L-arabinose transferase-like glycosyltransferase
MRTNKTARFRGMCRARSPVFWAARLSILGFLGWLWFVSAADSVWRVVSLAAAFALAALVSLTWYVTRAQVERRRQAALDAYAERGWRTALDTWAEQELEQAKRSNSSWAEQELEQAKRTNSWRNCDAGPQSQDR